MSDTDNTVVPSSTEDESVMSFDEAFDKFASGELDRSSFSLMDGTQNIPTSADDNKDTSDGGNVQVGAVDGTETPNNETNTDANTGADTNNAQPAGQPTSTGEVKTEDTGAKKKTNEGGIDYQQLYEAKAQQFRSLEGRINVIKEESSAAKARLRELEAALAATNSHKSSTSTTGGSSQMTDADFNNSMPDSLKEFVELYPDFAGPVKEMVNMHVSNAVKQFEEKIKPIENKLRQSEDDAHYGPIYKAHPDWNHIVESGDLHEWKDSLPRLQRLGVEWTIANGSSDAVIDMFNEYKRDRKFTGYTSSTNATPVSQAGNTASNSIKPQVKPSVNTDTVNRLKNAMAVPTGRAEEPKVLSNDPDPNDFNSWWDRFANS